jgi:predicted acetyltransferase
VTDPQFPIPEYIQNIQKLTTKVSGKMMMRIVDFVNYCASIKVPEDCSEDLILQLSDSACPWNEGTFSIKARKGKLKASKINEGLKPSIVLNPYTLSLIIGGRTPAVILRDLGKINCTESTALILDALFPVENFISYFRF